MGFFNSLSALVALLVCFASSTLIARRRKGITVEPITRKGLAVRKHVGRHDRYIGTKVFIPNMFAKWPWSRYIHPNYAMLKTEVDAWINSFRAFSPRAQDAFNRCDFNLLACLAYPTASKEHARAGCGLMHLIFTIDEYSDRSTPWEVRQQKDIVLDALRNHHVSRPKGEWVGGEIARQFWELTIQSASTTSQKRLIQNMEKYIEHVVQESADKRDGRILDIKSYIEERRDTCAVKVAFCIIELGFDIPDEVMTHPIIQDLYFAAVDMIALSNDVFSYNLEQQRGDDLHNIVTCVMNECHTDVNGAILWVEDFLRGAQEKFHATLAALPQWEEPLNSQVRAYCDGLGRWIRANNDWSFESERYFGNKGPEMKEKRWMSLLPKKGATELGPLHIDSSLL